MSVENIDMPVNKEILEKALMTARKREAEEVFLIFSDLVIKDDADTAHEFLSNPELSWCIDAKKNLPAEHDVTHPDRKERIEQFIKHYIENKDQEELFRKNRPR